MEAFWPRQTGNITFKWKGHWNTSFSVKNPRNFNLNLITVLSKALHISYPVSKDMQNSVLLQEVGPVLTSCQLSNEGIFKETCVQGFEKVEEIKWYTCIKN